MWARTALRSRLACRHLSTRAWSSDRIHVVWLHATGMSGECYRPLASRVDRMLGTANSIKHHFPDQRAHGSGPPYSTGDALWYEDNVSDISGLVGKLKSMDPGPVLLVGHSMGGAVGMYVEARVEEVVFDGGGIVIEPVIPNLLLKSLNLVLPSPLARNAKRIRNSWKDREEARQYFERKMKSWDPAFLDVYMENCFKTVGDTAQVERVCHPEIMAKTMSRFGPLIRAGELAARGGAWKVLVGEKSTFPVNVGGPKYYQRLASKHKCELEVVSNAGHFAPMENPDAVACSVATHIRALAAR